MNLKKSSSMRPRWDRIQALRQELLKAPHTACLIEKPIEILYLTGASFSRGSLLISHDQAALFVDGRYIASARAQLTMHIGSQTDEHLINWLKEGHIQHLIVDSEAMSYARFLTIKSWKIDCQPLAKFLKYIRSIKDDQELIYLKKSAQIMWAGFNHLRTKLKPGITEREAAAELMAYCIKHGAEKMAFDPIVAFGANSAYVHHRPGGDKLKKHSIVLLDLGVVWQGYHSDMTRTLFIGKPDPELEHVWKSVVGAQKAALALCRPGNKIRQIDRAARDFLAKEGLESYFTHSLGHGVGLEIHEFPALRFDGPDQEEVLKKDMVITVEPGVYLPGKGGVRYEDTIVITEKSYRKLTPK